ncbi:DUF3239 domain-containing protein [Corynebacterium silvaticum]|uniref:DUF3239 domain-containing protein n=1 Tax=Corynebacterium silvaticum TaxID=2320431 RepID=A0A7Y4LHH1_9CORY|nr:DUF3239 domain-containing protein [Corynebacterium silvaticum]ARU45759.1 DUF3239 domain-containing protein [Corynebacterium silvaticum]MBH5300302.1 DUF3239 domain-containing protein [Corynebacterium silvaticum]NOM64498.1 DUF3239 domain-containing protein [Corynebacterium silvaticum]NON70015.1 DUF3239 domain-containing protein [Corynebacterium silvaticum]TFA93152.1 DUF3239 domain-containing protein [Corynebacterium silvaticum]
MQKFSFPIDSDYAKKNNELLKDTKRLQLSAGLFGLIQLVIGIALLLALGGTFGGIVFAIFAVMALISFAMITVIPKKVGTSESLYQNYPLAAGMIAEVNPRDFVVMALVNANVDEQAPPTWALATRNITNLEGVERTVGERVPVVAVAGQRSVHSQGTWDQISPMPIGWATTDPTVIERAIEEIPDEQWNTLHKNLTRLDDVKETKFDLLVID